jgi:hypothetical protein
MGHPIVSGVVQLVFYNHDQAAHVVDLNEQYCRYYPCV